MSKKVIINKSKDGTIYLNELAIKKAIKLYVLGFFPEEEMSPDDISIFENYGTDGENHIYKLKSQIMFCEIKQKL